MLKEKKKKSRQWLHPSSSFPILSLQHGCAVQWLLRVPMGRSTVAQFALSLPAMPSTHVLVSNPQQK